MKFLFLALILASCSHSTKENTKLEVIRVSPTAVQDCQDYQKNVLDIAYIQTKDGSVQFTRDLNQASASLFKIDLEKGLAKTKASMVQNIIKECTPALVKKFDDDYKNLAPCNIMFSELNFFQGLANSLKKYPWPIELQLEGKKAALDYVRYYSEGHYPLLNRLVALSVLDELSANQIVNKDLHQEIKVLMQEAQIYVQGLSQQIKKDPSLSCDSLKVIRDELTYSQAVGKKMKGFLARI